MNPLIFLCVLRVSVLKNLSAGKPMMKVKYTTFAARSMSAPEAELHRWASKTLKVWETLQGLARALAPRVAV